MHRANNLTALYNLQGNSVLLLNGGPMRRFLQSTTLVLLGLAGAVALAATALWPRHASPLATPLPVAGDEQEIVWLYPATNTAAWERFVYAVKDLGKSQDAEEDALSYVISDQAFPPQSAVTPELVLSSPDVRGKLVIRWYKLTGDQDTRYWTRLLLDRRPPLLAIIGGSTSSAGIELAQCLAEETSTRQLGERAPLLLLTTATPTIAPVASQRVSAHPVYKGRTFRFVSPMADAHASLSF